MTRFQLSFWIIPLFSMSLAAIGGEDISASNAPLFFREDWKETPAATPVTQDHVGNPNLVLSLHGPDANSVKKSHHDNIPNDPFYIWSGECKQGCWGISLRDKNSLVDLSKDGHIRFRTMQTGEHILKIMLELADGKWVVSHTGFGETPDWHVYDQPLSKLEWRELNMDTMTAGRKVNQPDLTKVRAIGWTDLMTDNGSDHSTRIDWIEVYGRPVKGQ